RPRTSWRTSVSFLRQLQGLSRHRAQEQRLVLVGAGLEILERGRLLAGLQLDEAVEIARQRVPRVLLEVLTEDGRRVRDPAGGQEPGRVAQADVGTLGIDG